MEILNSQLNSSVFVINGLEKCGSSLSIVVNLDVVFIDCKLNLIEQLENRE